MAPPVVKRVKLTEAVAAVAMDQDHPLWVGYIHTYVWTTHRKAVQLSIGYDGPPDAMPAEHLPAFECAFESAAGRIYFLHDAMHPTERMRESGQYELMKRGVGIRRREARWDSPYEQDAPAGNERPAVGETMFTTPTVKGSDFQDKIMGAYDEIFTMVRTCPLTLEEKHASGALACGQNIIGAERPKMSWLEKDKVKWRRMAMMLQVRGKAYRPPRENQKPKYAWDHTILVIMTANDEISRAEMAVFAAGAGEGYPQAVEAKTGVDLNGVTHTVVEILMQDKQGADAVRNALDRSRAGGRPLTTENGMECHVLLVKHATGLETRVNITMQYTTHCPATTSHGSLGSNSRHCASNTHVTHLLRQCLWLQDVALLPADRSTSWQEKFENVVQDLDTAVKEGQRNSRAVVLNRLQQHTTSAVDRATLTIVITDLLDGRKALDEKANYKGGPPGIMDRKYPARDKAMRRAGLTNGSIVVWDSSEPGCVPFETQCADTIAIPATLIGEDALTIYKYVTMTLARARSAKAGGDGSAAPAVMNLLKDLTPVEATRMGLKMDVLTHDGAMVNLLASQSAATQDLEEMIMTRHLWTGRDLSQNESFGQMWIKVDMEQLGLPKPPPPPPCIPWRAGLRGSMA